MTEENNESAAEETVDSLGNTAQSATNVAQNALENAADATGKLANRTQDATRNFVRRVMNGNKQ